MDDHPPSWDGNGLAYLQPYVADLAPNISRVNFFLPRAADSLARAVDGLPLSKALVENFSITSIELYRCNLNVEDVTALAQALSVNKFVTYVGLARNRFYTAGGIFVAEMLKVNQTIVTIDLSWNELRDEFAVSVAEALTMNNSVQRLVLDKNRITSDGTSALAHAIGVNRKLRYVSLAQNNVSAFGVGYLAKSLTSHVSSALQTLNISANAVSAAGMFTYFSTIATAPRASNLVTLNVSYNKIESSVLLLGAALMKLPQLRELNLEYTHLQYSTELREFAKALAAHRSIVNISFARNPLLGNEGVDTVCEALGTAAIAKWVDLSDTGIKKSCVDESIKKLVHHAKHLETLHLSDNDFSETDCGGSLASVMSAAESLKYLSLQRCRLGMHGMERLFTALQYKPLSVTGMSLRGNGCGDAGFAQLLPFVLHHGRFTFLDIAQNELTNFIHPRLPDVFQANHDLEFLCVDDTTVFTRETVKGTWDDVARRSQAPSTASLPPLCDAAAELRTGLPPSAGFATYSAAIGSTMRRQVEESANLVHGLLPMAGHPVQHCSVWRGNECAVTPNLRAAEYRGGPSDAATVSKMENNIGGLLLSDDQLRREFNRLDAQGTGVLSGEDFKKIYRAMEHYGVERSDKEIDRVLQRFGGGADQLTFDVFCVVMLKLAQH